MASPSIGIPTLVPLRPRVVTTSPEPGDTLASSTTKATHMSDAIRRCVRLTVLSPTGHTDLAVADDVVGAEVVRLVVAGHDRDASSTGWELLHPTRGVLPLERTLGHERPLTDGDVLLLRPRTAVEASPPVDDVAEHARAAGGPARPGLGGVITTVLAVLIAPSATVVVRTGREEELILAVTAMVIGLAAPFLTRGRTVAAMAGAAALPAVAVSAWSAAQAIGAGVGTAALAAIGGALAVAVVALATVPGRWWRPAVVALGSLFAVSGVHAAATLTVHDEPRAAALAATAAVCVLAAGPRISLATSGLGRLDDRVAAGEQVREDRVREAVDRASDDLAAITLVVGVAVVALAGPLATAGAFGGLLALTIAALTGARARAMVRPIHVVPLVLGAGLAAAHVLVVSVAGEDTRAVPVLVVALTVLVVLLATATERG
ncbi:hypothetical protein GCM10025883_13880 [Mobilicoccus caccae]|uniref:EccD-like transmembrane domain-containing protein n=2 Tax=Mobilicoccus caccae TaxID=1859295 RepID=A0ABQ6IQ12_9MICO|nr:hypothetical protein GCM10025883_13880 [Mobilicoccus caccae]